jgi:hypothetical protein
MSGALVVAGCSLLAAVECPLCRLPRPAERLLAHQVGFLHYPLGRVALVTVTHILKSER